MNGECIFGEKYFLLSKCVNLLTTNCLLNQIFYNCQLHYFITITQSIQIKEIGLKRFYILLHAVLHNLQRTYTMLITINNVYIYTTVQGSMYGYII